jgi:AraC-like DNA-binding protein
VTSDEPPLELSVRDIGRGEYPPGAIFGPRKLLDFELVWMLAGTAEWVSGGRRARLEPGQLLLAQPGATDSFRWDPQHHSSHAYVHFELTPGPDAERLRQWPLVVELEPDDVRHALLSYLSRLGAHRAAGWQDQADAVTLLLLQLVVSGTLPATEETDPLPDSLERVASYARTTWHREVRALTLDEMAAAANMSKGHLCRLFRSHFGLGPAKAFELVRLEHAARLLTRSNLTVAQASRVCGYANPYHFSRNFRAAFGTPPSHYRGTAGSGQPAVQPGLAVLASRIWPDVTLETAHGGR